MHGESKVLFSLFGFLDVTGEVVTMWIILAAIALLSLVVSRNLKEKPGVFQNMVETGVEYLENFLTDILGHERARKNFTFLSSLFIFIIVGNYSGMFPGVGLTDYVKAPTASLSVTVGLGVITFVFLQYSGLKCGVKNYFKRFVSPMAFMFPLLLVDEFIKPASLALRLFGNIFGEEMVTEQLYHIFPIGIPVVMMVLSILFCALQAMVFTMLTSIYLEEVTEIEE